MFKNTFQSGFLSVLYSIGSKPLQIWDKKVRNGHIKRITDNDIQSLVLEIEGTNVSTTYITCPADPKKTLGIKLPFLVMIIKNLKKYFTFEVQVLDDKNVRRRFRASNYQSTTRVKPFICTMPMRLDDGWNQIQFNLSDFTRRAYGTNYIETLRVQVRSRHVLPTETVVGNLPAGWDGLAVYWESGLCPDWFFCQSCSLQSTAGGEKGCNQGNRCLDAASCHWTRLG
uniref:Cilia and flagella associated protein 20 n=1 Tax=Calidris pygmaea TaxID=425635 RepID=A0A8C3JTF8_9CHAR